MSDRKLKPWARPFWRHHNQPESSWVSFDLSLEMETQLDAAKFDSAPADSGDGGTFQ